ncbi:MAG TPA: hypothetical protein VLS45_03335, partial [Methylomicrobium sp.]|nr:hypothetical protein [Methylomicrobium sp.]
MQASRKCSQPIEVAPLSESACALLAGVMQGYETTSNLKNASIAHLGHVVVVHGFERQLVLGFL